MFFWPLVPAYPSLGSSVWKKTVMFSGSVPRTLNRARRR